MALIPMEYEGGVVETTLSPASGSEAVSNYGTMRAIMKKDSGIAEIAWTGGSTAPTAGTYDFVLPSEYTPKRSSSTYVRNGSYMEVRTDGKVRLALTTSTYSGATLTYILAD